MSSSVTSVTAPRSTAYVVAPPGGVPAPGVLVLHAWWGMTDHIRSVCDRLADAGFVALAPDLYFGAHAETPDEAERLLADSDPSDVTDLIRTSASTLAKMPATTDGPIGVVGFSMGASYAVWLAARGGGRIGAVVTYYGTSDVDTADATAPVLGHFAEHDEFVTDDQIDTMHAFLGLSGCEVEIHHYAGTGHWFAESDRPAAYDSGADQLAWSRTVEFLSRHLGSAANAR